MLASHMTLSRGATIGACSREALASPRPRRPTPRPLRHPRAPDAGGAPGRPRRRAPRAHGAYPRPRPGGGLHLEGAREVPREGRELVGPHVLSHGLVLVLPRRLPGFVHRARSRGSARRRGARARRWLWFL